MMFVVFLSTTLPQVHAQSTEISALTYADHLTLGDVEPVSVKANVAYAAAPTGFSLVVGVLEADSTPPRVVSGIAMAAPETCMNQPVLEALCVMRPSASSGVERLEFRVGGILGEPQGSEVWRLNMSAVMLTSNGTIIAGSSSSVVFSIRLVGLTLAVSVPANVAVTVDGKPQPPGPARVVLAVGEHELSVPAFAQVDNFTRLRFDRWADGGNQPDRSVYLRENAAVEAQYITQYYLVLSSSQSEPTGAGWYDDGSNVTFAVKNTTQPMGGWLGMLGAKWKFQGWYEDGKLLTEKEAGFISVDGPHRLSAVWTADYSAPAAIVAATLVLLALAALVFLRTRVRRSLRS